MKTLLNGLFRPILITGLAIVVLSACNDSSTKDPNSPLGQVVYDGTWEQIGYGLFVEIDANNVTRYEASTGSCIKTHTLPRSGFPENFNWTISEFNYDSFDVYSYDNVGDDGTLSKVAQLPASCATPLSNSPTSVVNHLISMADDYYAFFAARNIDWNAIKAEALSVTHDGMGEQDLAAVVTGILAALNDAHVMGYFKEIDPLQPDFDFDYLIPFFEPENIYIRTIREYHESPRSMSLEEYFFDQIDTYFQILDSYMDAPLIARGGEDSDKVQWSTIDQNIGYLQIRDLGGFDPSYASDSIGESRNPQPHLDAFNNVIDRVVEDLQHTSGIILDLRLHPGGTTELDRALANRFVSTDITYGSVAAPGAQSVSLRLSPYDGSRFVQPVVVISSQYNSSSAEDLIMALRADSDTTHIGERTHGILSDQLYLSLPNQWAFTLSNEIWRDATGVSWEAQGLPPTDEFDVYAISDRQTGVDTAIQKAIALLQ